MADREIRLVGSFKDDITPKLNKLTRSIDGVVKSFEKLQSKLRPIARDMGTIAMASARVSDAMKDQRGAFETSIRGMQAYKKELGSVVSAQKKLANRVTLPAVQQPRPSRGGGGGRRGGGGGNMAGAAAVGTFLGGGALMAATGAANSIGNSVRSAFGFLGDRFKEAMQDEISDIQAQGAIFGVLRKEGLTADYKEGKKIAKTLDIEIAKMVASSPIPTATITTLNRTLSDTFLPGLMKGFKAEGASTFEAARNSAKQLAGFYEQIGYLTPPNYPIGMVTKGITKLIESGRITGELAQIDFFQLNPQLIPELRRQNFEGAKTIMERMKILQSAMSVVMPPEAMAEIRTSLSAGMQGLQDNLMNVSVGLLSFASEFKKSKVVSYIYRDLKSGKMMTGFREVTTPFQLISTKLAPVLTELGAVVGAIVDKIGPVTQHLAEAFAKFFGPALQDLTKALGGIVDAINKGDLKDMGEILGKVVGNILKALSQGFDAIGDANGPMGEFMASFTKGLNSVFPKEAQDRLAKNLETAFGTLLSKTVELAAPPLAALLVATVTRFIEGLFNAGVVGKLLLGAGALKLLGKGSIRQGASTAAGGLMNVAGMAGAPIGPGRTKGRAAVMARRAGRQSVGAFQQMPGVAKAGAAVKPLVQGAKMKGVGILAAGAVKMATVSPELAKVGQSLTSIGKRVPLLNVAFAGLDFATRKAAGASTAEAAAGAGGSLAGGIVGGAIGTAILPGIGTAIGATLGSLLGDWLGTKLPGMLASVGPALSAAWSGLVNFVKNLPQNLLFGIGYAIGMIQNAWDGLSNFVRSLPGRISAAIAGLMAWLAALPGRIGALVNSFMASASTWPAKVGSALTSVGTAILNWAKGLPGRVWSMLTGAAAQVQAGQQAARQPRGKSQYSGSGTGSFMPLGGAVAKEMKMKPPGSDLVIANSSELIIPTKHAAEGQGTVGALVAPLVSIDAKTSTVAAYINQMRSQLGSAVRQTTAAVNTTNARLSSGMPVKVVNQPTVKFAMGGGFARGGIGGFPKTSGFGMRWGRMHQGNDYGMPVGTPLGIGGPGKVLFAGSAGGYGNMVDIGGPGGMVYRFAHLSKIMAPVGANLPPGMAFAKSGNTGRSTGPHLHFEARPGGGGAVNPDAFAGIIRAGYAGMPVGPLMEAAKLEMSKMPYGAQLAVRNTDEIFMKPQQMSQLVEGATSAGVSGAGNVTLTGTVINVNGVQNPQMIAEQVAGELLTAMYKATFANDGRQG